MSQADVVVIEITGEGRTELGMLATEPEEPDRGVVPVLVFALCGRPSSMRVMRRPMIYLQGKGLWQKVRFAKRRARDNRSAGAVFVHDTEGDLYAKARELQKGRDAESPDFPMAIGAPHPCIEAWLLSNPAAVKSALRLAKLPSTPDDSEGLPAPRDDRKNNPKSVLHRCAGGAGSDLSAAEKTRIAAEIRSLQGLRDRCPLSFAPFADEIHARIKPLFP